MQLNLLAYLGREDSCKFFALLKVKKDKKNQMRKRVVFKNV